MNRATVAATMCLSGVQKKKVIIRTVYRRMYPLGIADSLYYEEKKEAVGNR